MSTILAPELNEAGGLFVEEVSLPRSAAPTCPRAQVIVTGGRFDHAHGGLGRTAGLGQVGDEVKHLLKLLKADSEQLEPHDLLHLLVAGLVPPDKAKSCSASLLDHFGTLGDVLAAPWHRLEAATEQVDGLAGVLKTVDAIVLAVVRQPLLDRPLINSSAMLERYLTVSLGRTTSEMVRVLFLDVRNGLIKDELHGRGSVDRVMFCQNEVIRRALELKATSIILVHNHPSGDPTPSEQDVAATREIAAGLGTLKIKLHDHVIVGRAKCVSLRRLGML